MGFVVGRSQMQSRCAVLAVKLEAAESQAVQLGLDEERMVATVERISKTTLHEATERLVTSAQHSLGLANLEAKNDLDQQRSSIEHLMRPVHDNLAKLEEHIHRSERVRKEEYGGLFQQMQAVAETNLQVKAEAAQLKNVLKSSTSQRGRWGEVQLRRVVELAGMAQHCDFTEQSFVVNEEAKRSRADLIVLLPGDMKIAVDAKVPFDAYERACGHEDPVVQKQLFGEHARQLRAHVDELARRAYWDEYKPSCGFTVMFVPGEALLDAALTADPMLWEHASAKQILLATPSTLIAMLRMASVGWLQQRQTANAAEIAKAGKELHNRLSKLGDHMDKLGRSLRGAVGSYNDLVGSLESRVLPSARKLSELGISDVELDHLVEINEAPRALRSEALLSSVSADVAALESVPKTADPA